MPPFTGNVREEGEKGRERRGRKESEGNGTHVPQKGGMCLKKRTNVETVGLWLEIIRIDLNDIWLKCSKD